MNGEAYFLAINGQQTGPFSTEQVQDMWRAGMVSAQTLFWRKGESSWQPLGGMVAPQPMEMPYGGYPMSANVPPGYFAPGVVPRYYVAPENCTLAVVSFGLALAGFVFLFTWLPAILLGHVALSQIRRSGGRLLGQGYAVAGLAISYLALFFGLLLAAFFYVTPAHFAYFGTESSQEAAVQEATVQEATVLDSDAAANQDLGRAQKIWAALNVYATDHEGMAPANLDDLFPTYLKDRAELGGDGNTGFDYLAPGQKLNQVASDKILLLGQADSANGKKVTVYGNGKAGFKASEHPEPPPTASP